MILQQNIQITDVKDYVIALYHKFQKAELLYHNLQHTEKVVKRCYEIAERYSLTTTDLFILIAAAWFHDTGQLFGDYKGHEEKSVEIMKNYFHEKITDDEIIEIISSCIMATNFFNSPHTLLEEIICDADTYNIGTDEFLITDSLVHQEFTLRSKCLFPDWDAKTLMLLEKHKYYTSYCQQLLNAGKQKNIELVKSRINNHSV